MGRTSLAALGPICACLSLASCDVSGELRPLADRGAGGAVSLPGVVAMPGVHYVEPFDYHYPDEAFYDDIADRVLINVALGEFEPGTLVYVPTEGPGVLLLEPTALTSDSGVQLSADNLDIKVVTFADRSRAPQALPYSASRLDMVWRSGIRRETGSQDARGLHEDARSRLPLVPLVLVNDAALFEERKASASPTLSLPFTRSGRAQGQAGRGTQFWVTVHIPKDLALSQAVTRFVGSLKLTVGDGGASEIPIEVNVLNTELDTLESHERFVGVLHVADPLERDFSDAIALDVLSHGANLTRGNFRVPEDYLRLKQAGFQALINTDSELSASAFAEVSALGFEPLVATNLWEPTLAELALEGPIVDAIHAKGGRYFGTMTFGVLQALAQQTTVDWWSHALTTYELDARSPQEFTEFLAHLERLRSDPSAKLAANEFHFAEVFNGHAPHQARLLYGFWLYRSGLNGATVWGYSDPLTLNPFTEPAHDGVAFQVRYTDHPTNPSGEAMLPSYTWEAFREGVDDLRYALTAERLVRAQLNPELDARFASIVAGYDSLYENGDRLDYRKRESDLRSTRKALFDLIAELL